MQRQQVNHKSGTGNFEGTVRCKGGFNVGNTFKLLFRAICGLPLSPLTSFAKGSNRNGPHPQFILIITWFYLAILLERLLLRDCCFGTPLTRSHSQRHAQDRCRKTRLRLLLLAIPVSVAD